MSEEIENEVELIEDEVEIEETVQMSQVVEHDAETQALMQSEGLVSEEASLGEEPPEVFVEQDQLLSLIESLLFASPKPLSFEVMKQVFKGTNVKTKDLRKALQDYASFLAESKRGVYLEEIAGGYQLRTKLDNVQFLKNSTKQRPFKVSGPSMETLAIIAYKQPCIKAEVDSIRGVESGHLIRVLMDKGLVQFEGKSDLPGKPMLYKTTKKFLEVFGLRNIRELPSLEEIEQLIPEGIAPAEDKKTLDQLTGELSLDYALRDMEAEDELNKISDKLGEIKTTSDYFEQEKIRQREQRDKDRSDDIRERLLIGQYVEDTDMTWLKKYEQRKEAEALALSQAKDQAVSEEAQKQSDSDSILAQKSDSTHLEALESPIEEINMVSTQVQIDASVSSFSEESELKNFEKDSSTEEISFVSLDINSPSENISAEIFLENEVTESGSVEELAASVDVNETAIDFSNENSVKGEITSENVTHVARKLTGLAGNALDAFKAFDDEEDQETKNKIDI